MAYNRQTVLTVGLPIKVAILEAGLFQNEAAKKLGIPVTTFNMKILGRRTFTPDEKQRLAKLTGKPVSVLFPEDDNIKSVSDTQEQSGFLGECRLAVNQN